MKTGKSSKRGSTKRSKGTPTNFTEYLATVPKPARGALRKIRGVIRAALPREAIETISYGIPAFRSERGPIVWFAAFSGHSTSKGTVHFPLGKALPALLITKLVKARVKQSENKKQR